MSGGEGRIHQGVPRWPAQVALLGIAVVYAILSGEVTPAPRGLLVGIVVALLILLVGAHVRGWHGLARILALTVTGVVTLAVAASAILLIATLLRGGTRAPVLLRDAALIWVTNVLVFSVWYWEIDGGGPERRRVDSHHSEDFLFPQMAANSASASGWSPGFVDYLFLAFNTSTAFSPTDTAVLSRRAKLLMMAQSLISLLVIAVLAARAINTL